jgi:hypothetical protein
MMLSFKIFTLIQNVLTIVSIMASTVSMLFWNAYVQRYVYIIYIESKVARHTAAHVPIPLMVDSLMTILVLDIHINFV